MGPVSNGCQGALAGAALDRRCKLLMEGNVEDLFREAHEARAKELLRQQGLRHSQRSSPHNQQEHQQWQE
jgi:hypothetical protein